jgi:hypothetical protein
MPTVLTRVAVVILLGGLLACRHPGPAVGGTKTPEGTGTIAGVVSVADGRAGLAGRKVTAVETASQTRYEATTGADGGYTIKVPMGHYRLELELKAGETLQKHPDETTINRSDIDSGRNFVVANSR